jgi:Pyruvate/2-oxoacid:ferredoxin oxidoreductase delta subunit
MADQIYEKLMQSFARRGGLYPGMDIPEFFEMAGELFTPEEASVAAAMPEDGASAEQLAQVLEKGRGEVESTLEAMARKGLCYSEDVGGTESYSLPALVPGIFELQFMRGTRTQRDRKLAKLIRAYTEAIDASRGAPEMSSYGARVITVDAKIESGNKIHTYDQMSAYVANSDPISVSTCYCRHEAKLIDESDTCGKPDDVCMQLGTGARFAIDKGLGREVSKKEAMEILEKSEKAGLVHLSNNQQQNIDWVCNCCADHCTILKIALAQPNPGLAINSGFQPKIDQEECTACELCVDNCPATALAVSEDDILLLDTDRCLGCGVCATTCPTEAIALVEKAGHPEPPVDDEALRAALKDQPAAF